MRRPEYALPVALASAALIFYAGKAALNSNTEPDSAVANAEAVAARVAHELGPNKDIEVAAAIIEVDGGVNFRSSPVVLNTNNNQMVTGNVINEASEDDITEGALSHPTILVRPVVIRNEDQLSDDDPDYWLAGLEDDKLVWVGVNQDTAEHMHAYQRPLDDGNMPGFTDNVHIDYVRQDTGIVFQSDGYVASAGLIRPATGTNDPYLLSMQAMGYQEVPLPLN
jgi:hypothetical protein